MKGHIRERSPGTWAVSIQVGQYANGRPRYKWHTVKGGKRDAQRELNRLLAEMQAGDYVEPTKLTVGQYLRPSAKHLPVARYWHPDEFARLAEAARALGFAHVEAGPLVRSSYHAGEQAAAGLRGPS